MTSTNGNKTSIVLVHGAFADGSGWQHVIPPLESAGYRVTAVQNPMTSLADDVATTKRVIDAQPRPVVVVGHSYGGAVMTGAAAGNPNVKALVYIAAFAPDAGETATALLAKYPNDLNTALEPDAAGFVYIDRAKFHDVFAGDVEATEARVMAATQKPIFGHIFDEAPKAAAWKTIPTWFIVAKGDHVINPDLERFFAHRMGATTSEVQSSHVPFISQPKAVVGVIEAAAKVAAAA